MNCPHCGIFDPTVAGLLPELRICTTCGKFWDSPVAAPAAEAPAPTVGDGGMRAVMDSLPENDQVAAVAFSLKAVPAPTADAPMPDAEVPKFLKPSEVFHWDGRCAEPHKETLRRLAASRKAHAATATRLAEAERERDAYKKAKQENDERFMVERDEARADRDDLRKWKADANVVLDGYFDALKGQCNLGEFMPDAVKRIVAERGKLLRFAGEIVALGGATGWDVDEAAHAAGMMDAGNLTPLGEAAVRAAKEASRG